MNAGGAPRILCTGIIVLDEVFRVEEFPQADGKVEAKDFFVVNGGCAANAAVAIARLGGRAAMAGPLGGPAGQDSNGDRVLAALNRENVDTTACHRVSGLATALSAIFVNARGDRTIVTYRDQRVAAVVPDDPETIVASANLVLADNRYPDFARPICEAARRRRLPVVLDGDKPTKEDDPLFRIASHVVFSSECLKATTGGGDLSEGLKRIARHTDAFLAVSNGPTIFFSSRRLGPPRAGVRHPRGGYARRRRCIAWRLRAGAGRRARARPKPCASARRSPASNAPALAGPPACRSGRKSRLLAEGGKWRRRGARRSVLGFALPADHEGLRDDLT
jgi:sulfofructose kinase